VKQLLEGTGLEVSHRFHGRHAHLRPQSHCAQFPSTMRTPYGMKIISRDKEIMRARKIAARSRFSLVLSWITSGAQVRRLS